MTKGIQLMSQIAALARQAIGELQSEEDKQAATEIKLAAECVVNANARDARHPSPATRHLHD